MVNFYKNTYDIIFVEKNKIYIFFVSLLFSSLLTIVAKNLGDDLLKAWTAREGLPFWQNSFNTFCRGLLKLQKKFNNIYRNMNIYGCTVPQTHLSHVLYIS